MSDVSIALVMLEIIHKALLINELRLNAQCPMHNALCIISSVTSAMLIMLDTPLAICSYALMDIEARPHQCANTMITDTQAGFRMTFAIVLVY